MKDGTGLGLRSGDSSGFCPSSCGKSDRSARTCTLPAGLEQKSMSHPRQELRFKQNPSNFTTVIRSTELTQQHCPVSPALQTQTCYPDQRPSHREEDNRLKTAACKKKMETNRKARPHASSQHPFQKSVAKCAAVFLPQIQAESKKKLYQQPQPRDTVKRSPPEHPALSVGCLSITLSTSGQIFTSKKFKTERAHTHKKRKNALIWTIYSTQSSAKQLKLPRRI